MVVTDLYIKILFKINNCYGCYGCYGVIHLAREQFIFKWHCWYRRCEKFSHVRAHAKMRNSCNKSSEMIGMKGIDTVTG